jgi:hypothetical protein
MSSESEPKTLTLSETLQGQSDGDLFALWAATMDELKRRGVIRTANNPVADYAEYLVAHELNATLAHNSNAGYDAIGSDGTRYQIKARRMTRARQSRQLGVLRNLESDGFDVLAIVLFGPAFELEGIWLVPIEIVLTAATYRPHVNGHVLHARPSLLNDPRVTRLM